MSQEQLAGTSSKGAAGSTPVLIGIGTAMQRSSEPQKSLEASELMAEAARSAIEDCGVPDVVQLCDSIAVPRGTWQYSNPAQLIAEAVGADHAKTILADIGVLQQSLISKACTAIQNGAQRVALVCGGEAKYRAIQISKQGLDMTDTDQHGAKPDEFLSIADDIISPVEMQRGMAMPVTPYAIMESAMRYADGISINQHRNELGELYAQFSAIAAENPDAWIREPYSADDIAQASDANKMLAFPYTKRMNTQWNVDQAAALLFTSLETAQQLGICEDKLIFPLSSTESEHMTLVSERAELHRCPGARIAGLRAAELANVGIADIDYLEFYSCFPAAVKAYARELNVASSKPPVVTGSMAFAGGPLNNFVYQSTASMARLLRDQPGKTGMVSSVSGMLTKQAFAVWSSTPAAEGFQFDDVSAQTAEQTQRLPLNAEYQGSAEVAGYTVNSIPGFPQSLITVCNTPTAERAIAISDNEALIRSACSEELCGKTVSIGANSELSFTQ